MAYRYRPPKQKNGRKWRCYYVKTGIDLPTAKKRLAACPLEGLKEKVSFTAEGRLRYRDGLIGEEVECARWILLSRVPDERQLSVENADAIFEWVRQTA